MNYAQKLSRMIQCETVSERGDLHLEKFEHFQSVLRELFPNVFRVMEFKSFDGAILLKWKADKPAQEPVLLMSHQDVVEATGEWKHPPFSGEIVDGVIWGRGTVDTKGSLCCIFQSIEELIEEGFSPSFDIYIASSNTEEVAGEGAPKTAAYLKSQGVHLQYLIDEGGMIKGEPLKGAKGTFAMIGCLEKGTNNYRFVARGTGGHASAPGRNTPLVRLGRFMAEMEDHDPFKAEMNATTIEMFRRLGPTIDGPMGFVLRHAKGLSPLLKHVLPKINPLAGAMIKTTLAFTTAHGSEGLNVLPETAYVTGNCRVIHHCASEKTLEILKERAARHDIEVEVIMANEPCPVVDYNGKGFRRTEELVKRIFPGVIPSPYAMTGGTDARFYGEIADDCIRFAPLEINEQQYKSIHAVNENINAATLEKGVLFYKELIKSF